MTGKRPHICKFCEKGFTSERTLSSHMCVRKKRWAERDMIGCQLGFRVFQEFYTMTMNSKKLKTLEEFIYSPYYMDFVKFGRYLVEVDPLYSDKFVKFVIENGVKLKHWRAEYVYDKYLEELMKTEPVEKAIERTILTMQRWAEENETGFEYFFEEVNINEAVNLIRSGKISPWVLYLSGGADNLFDRLNEEQGKLIQSVINPSKWQVIFMRKTEDVDFVRDILENSGI